MIIWNRNAIHVVWCVMKSPGRIDSRNLANWYIFFVYIDLVGKQAKNVAKQFPPATPSSIDRVAVPMIA